MTRGCQGRGTVQEVDEQDLYVERVPHEDRPGRRLQEVRAYATTTAVLLELADWLRCQSVVRVVMESTSDYWKGAFWLLEAEGFACWLVNARQVKDVPGRAKTDRGGI
ncbi:transposase [Nonomuraea sp. NPDC050451]|uniref:IS110 family transposase n=1 Tax=Nonomuraea sp. NPDC050451 TaxID=3364364 RepID=UPI0037AABEDA